MHSQIDHVQNLIKESNNEVSIKYNKVERKEKN
jgi:hypothetical protein